MMAKNFYQTFDVLAVFDFPIDMLRFDSAFPASEQDSNKIVNNLVHHLGGGETIKVARYVDSKASQPTIERWESFDCIIRNIEVGG